MKGGERSVATPGNVEPHGPNSLVLEPDCVVFGPSMATHSKIRWSYNTDNQALVSHVPGIVFATF